MVTKCKYCGSSNIVVFQPFLRFWQYPLRQVAQRSCGVSTLLEILGLPSRVGTITHYRQVSTLLEILGLVCLVVVGF